MGDVVRAVRPRKSNGHGIESRLAVVTGRVDSIEQALIENREAAKQQHEATHGLLEEVLNRLGNPQNGTAHPATGLYWAVETVSERVKPFERMWEQVKGSFKTVAFFALPMAGLVWFLAGDRITTLFHG